MMIPPTTSCLHEKISHHGKANLYLVAEATFSGFTSVRGVVVLVFPDASNTPEPVLPDPLTQTGVTNCLRTSRSG